MEISYCMRQFVSCNAFLLLFFSSQISDIIIISEAQKGHPEGILLISQRELAADLFLLLTPSFCSIILFSFNFIPISCFLLSIVMY